MWRLVLVLFAVLLAGALGACGEAASGNPQEDQDRADPAARPGPEARARNLLLITVDTLRADHLGYAGGRAAVSPRIDELAAEGASFDQCHAPMGMTLPSVTTLMTSRYPDETGVRRNSQKVAPDEVTLAERLADVGFRTRAMVATSVLQPHASNIEQGFDDYRVIEQEGWMTDHAIQILKHDFGKDPARGDFLWMHYMDPHQPYEAVEPFASAFDPDYAGPWDATEESLQRIFVEKIDLDADDLDHIKAAYDSQIRRIDLYVRWLLMALASSGHEQETLVVFTADHGEDLYDHNHFFYHGSSLYRSVTHVPLLFRQPGTIPTGQRVTDLVELVDVMPTILTHLGVSAAPPGVSDSGGRPLRGHDLAPTDPERRRAGRGLAFAQLAGRVYGVRTPDWFYVSNPSGFMPKSIPVEGRYTIERRELYDLRTDPREQVNIVEEHADVVQQLERVLTDWKGSLDQGASQDQDLDAETLRMLEQLGYVEDDH